MSAMAVCGPVTAGDVERVQARAYAADEKADAAGLLLAECLVTGLGDVLALLHEFRCARASAAYAWAAYSDALDQQRHAARMGVVSLHQPTAD